MSDNLDRRGFLKQAAAAGFSVSLAAQALGAAKPAPKKAALAKKGKGPVRQDRKPNIPGGAQVNIAVIGVNSRGMAHLACLTNLPGVTVTHVCDVDSRALDKGIKSVKDQTGKEPKAVKDVRRLLEDKSIDAVSIVTPDHWHTPLSIMALAAGKHVYCEKPATHNPYEGELLEAAVAQYKKVFQMGNQRRSYPNVIRAMEGIHSGKLIGRAYFARSWYANRRVGIGVGKAAPIPDWLGTDGYDLWQGPAPRKPFHDNVIHYNWHWFWHWGTGEALNNGTHNVDLCRWALGVDYPSRVVSTGGRYHITGPDDWETPDTQVISWDFAEGKGINWEGRSCNPFKSEGMDVGCVIYGTEGSVTIDGDAYTVYDLKGKEVDKVKGRPIDATNRVSVDLPGDMAHFYDFIEAVRTGKPNHSPAAEGVKSCHLLHLGNIALRTGHLLNVDRANGQVKSDAEALKLWRREYEKGWEPAQYVRLG